MITEWDSDSMQKKNPLALNGEIFRSDFLSSNQTILTTFRRIVRKIVQDIYFLYFPEKFACDWIPPSLQNHVLRVWKIFVHLLRAWENQTYLLWSLKWQYTGSFFYKDTCCCCCVSLTNFHHSSDQRKSFQFPLRTFSNPFFINT